MAIDTSRVLVTHEQIEEMLDRLAAQLNHDYEGKHLIYTSGLEPDWHKCLCMYEFLVISGTQSRRKWIKELEVYV